MAEIADSNAKKAASEATKASHDATKAGHYAAISQEWANLGKHALWALPLAIISVHGAKRLMKRKRPLFIRPEDTSFRSFTERLRGYKLPPANLNDLKFSKELHDRIVRKMEMIRHSLENKLPMSNLLFGGIPGTGKTLSAKTLVRWLHELGLVDFVSVSNLNQLAPKDRIRALVDTLAYIEGRKKPVYLIIEEADAVFPRRDDRNYSDQGTEGVINAMLTFFEKTSSKQIAFILTSNYPERLDSAILSRIDRTNRILFTPPEQKQREEILAMYFDRNLLGNGIGVSDEVINAIPKIASDMDGMVGRDIESFTQQCLQELMFSGKNELSLDTVEALMSSMAAAAA